MFNHPAQFISSLDINDSRLVEFDLLELWNSVESLSSRHFKNSLNYILNPKKLKKYGKLNGQMAVVRGWRKPKGYAEKKI